MKECEEAAEEVYRYFRQKVKHLSEPLLICWKEEVAIHRARSFSTESVHVKSCTYPLAKEETGGVAELLGNDVSKRAGEAGSAEKATETLDADGVRGLGEVGEGASPIELLEDGQETYDVYVAAGGEEPYDSAESYDDTEGLKIEPNVAKKFGEIFEDEDETEDFCEEDDLTQRILIRFPEEVSNPNFLSKPLRTTTLNLFRSESGGLVNYSVEIKQMIVSLLRRGETALDRKYNLNTKLQM